MAIKTAGCNRKSESGESCTEIRCTHRNLLCPFQHLWSVILEIIGSLFVSCCPIQTERTSYGKESQRIRSKLQWRGNQTG